MLSKEGQKIVKTALKSKFGHAGFDGIRKVLKNKAKLQYGCYFIEVPLENGVTICYTSNPNHFASFYLKLQLVGMTNTLALKSSDITKAGRQRGCSSYHAF
jgi:hypothetical protein